MEGFTRKMESLLQEKLSCYRHLAEVFEAEREHIVAMNVDALWKTTEQKKQAAAKIEQLRETILALLTETFRDRGDMDVRTFSLAFLLQNLPLSENEKAGLKRLKHEIDTEKTRVAQMGNLNRSYVNNYLSVIDDIMAVTVKKPNRTQYTGYGNTVQSGRPNSLIRAEV